jgi:hypothetical protein
VDTLRRALAVLVALRAATNLGKPFGPSGFVVLGQLLHGAASTVVAPLFGVAMLVYAWGLWHARPWALALGVAYAVWATANIALFPVFEAIPPQFTTLQYWLYFGVPGLVGAWLAVALLARARS